MCAAGRGGSAAGPADPREVACAAHTQVTHLLLKGEPTSTLL